MADLAAPEPPAPAAPASEAATDDDSVVPTPSFSDASNTGFDDGVAPDETAPPPPSPEPAPSPDSAPTADASEHPPSDEAEATPTAAFAAAPIPDAPEDPPASPEPPVLAETPDSEPDVTSMFAAAPEPASPSPLDPAEELANETETPAEQDAPEDALPPEADTSAAQPVAPAELEPAAPDELGVFPAITASGPPQYMPEPEPNAAAAPESEAPREAADRGEPTGAGAAMGPDTAPSDPDELGVIPVVGPLAEGPEAANLDEAPLAEPEPAPEAAPPPASQPEPVAFDAPPPAPPEAPATAEPPPSPESAAPPASAAATAASPEPAPPEQTAPAEPPPPPEPPAPAEPPPRAAIDPDGLINDVFADDLVDGRPPAASDELLDDADAWSDFAAGSAAVAATPDPPPSSASPPPPPPEPAPVTLPAAEPQLAGSFPGEDPNVSAFFTDTPETTGRRRTGAGGDGPQRPRRWSQTAIVALIVLGIIGAWFIVLAWITSGDDDDPTAGAGDDPTATVATSSSVVDQTTGAPATTATTSSTTTTTTLPTIEAVGDPIPVADLGLGAFALGPLEFPAADGLGRLVATFNQPDAIEDASGAMGLCADDAGFTAQWSSFTAIFVGAPETNVLVGYRLSSGGEDPFAALETLSGLQVGDTIESLEATYASFEISYEDIEGQPHFILVRQSDATTLLWGPVSSSEPDGIVQGIYSPLPCDGGPAASS